jgi:hypothetical protein
VSPLTIVAPTDSQLAYIRSLCETQGWQYPDAIASKAEAGEIIDAMKASTYNPERYAYPFLSGDLDVPF